MEVIKTRLISFIWSFAEATFFFFVPDIWLGHITIKNPKEAYKNIPVALTGALCGGICIYFLGRYMFEDIENIMVQIPAITQDMSTEVGEEIGNGNILLSTIIAGLTGVPYKLYALWAGLLEVSLVLFLAINPARTKLTEALRSVAITSAPLSSCGPII